MDAAFPAQLFPHFYLNGPPEDRHRHDYTGWGSYGQVLRRTSEPDQVDGQTSGEIQSQHVVGGETWIPVEPAVTPLFPPRKAAVPLSGPPFRPEDFPEHLQHFYVHHCMDSFSTMGRLLGEHFHFGKKLYKGRVNMGRMNNFIRRLKYKKCELGHALEHVHHYHRLMRDVFCDIPSALLAQLLHEELTLQKELEDFQPATTGGALGYVPLGEDQEEACLIYPTEEASSSLNFHRVVLEYSEDSPPSVILDSKPLTYDLTGKVRQISAARVDDECNVGVRSDYFCGMFLMKDGQRPRPFQVVQLKERCSSLSASPHLRGELVLASEGGAAYLWTVGKRPVKFREETSNLYFNAKSSWRWCEFSAHPRVLLFADRTGAELTDSRTRDTSHTLFRIGKTADCRRGERVYLAKFLSQGHPYHHLITTQFSAYVLDERMPSVPALKWSHMMDSPPCFAQILPAQDSSCTSKILLGAQRAQESVLLQYSGGREQSCQSVGPVQKLYSPCESLKIQQLPLSRHTAEQRLAEPAAGLCGTLNGGFLSVFQLTEAGDLFCQTLKLHTDTPPEQNRNIDVVRPSSSMSSAPGSAGEEEPQRNVSDEELFSDSNSETERYHRRLRRLTVVVNDDQGSHASDGEEEIYREPSSVSASVVRSAQTASARPGRPRTPEMLSEELKLVWEQWLSSLQSTAEKPSSPHQHIETRGLIRFKVHHRDQLHEDKLLSLRKDLTEAMKNRKLLVHADTYLPPLEIRPLPEAADAWDRPDDLSQRLTASWGDGWRNWWEEKLGLNQDTKIEALRRKRRQEKRTKARHRTPLSGSFTSTSSYQDHLSGWSSNTSQYLSSDVETFVSTAEDDAVSEPETLPRSPGPPRESTSRRSSPLEELLNPGATSGKPSEQEPESVSQSQVQDSAVETDAPLKTATVKKALLSSQKRQRLQQKQDYLSSLFGSQDPSQDPGQLDEGALPQHPGLPSAFRRLSQPRASSQPSQPQRKKSRMGF